MAPRMMWIGLGNLGRPMAKNLAEHGSLNKPVLLYNRTEQRAHDLAAKLGPEKATVSSSLHEGVSQADIVFSTLSNDAVVQETYDAVIAAAGHRGDSLAGKLFVECSTIAPETAQDVAGKVLACGGEFVASPVFGAPAYAEARQLVFVTAGPSPTLAKLRPYIVGVMGRAEIPFENQPCGTASKLKLIGNTFVNNMAAQLAEGFVLAEKSGIGTEPVKRFVDLLFGGPYTGYADRMLSGTYWRMKTPLGSCNMALKDLTHALAIAEGVGVELRNARVALDYLNVVKEHVGGEKGDLAGMYGAARLKAGMPYKNE